MSGFEKNNKYNKGDVSSKNKDAGHSIAFYKYYSPIKNSWNLENLASSARRANRDTGHGRRKHEQIQSKYKPISCHWQGNKILLPVCCCFQMVSQETHDRVGCKNPEVPMAQHSLTPSLHILFGAWNNFKFFLRTKLSKLFRLINHMNHREITKILLCLFSNSSFMLHKILNSNAFGHSG